MDIENQVREIEMKQFSKCLIYTMYNKDSFLTKTIFMLSIIFTTHTKYNNRKQRKKIFKVAQGCGLSYD